MNGNEAHNASPAGSSSGLANRATFATSSTDFALPFGATRGSSSSASNHAPSWAPGSSSGPISIPTRPFPTSNAGASTSTQPPLLSLGHLASSPSRFASSATGLGIGMLPSPSARDQSNPLAQPHPSILYAQPASPTLSLAGEGWPPPPATALSSASTTSPGGASASAALLRRSQGMNSPGFAIASPARFRRASMLGREITPFHLDPDDRSDEERQTESRAGPSPDDGDDEMMQVEDEDVTVSRAPSTPVMGPPLSLANTPSTPPPAHPVFRHSTASSALTRASASDSGHDSSSSASGATSALGALGASTSSMSRAVPHSPSAGASMGSPLGHGNRSRSSSLLSSNVVRKAVTRRGNLLPRDRSVLRVAASLQDESKPEDSEIASEAKLQKRLGGEATLPRTPRFGPSGSAAFGGSGTRVPKSPSDAPAAPGFGTASSRRKYMWDDDVDDIRGVFCADGLDDDSSDQSEDEEEMMMYYSRTASVSDDDEAPLPDATPMRDADAAGDAAMGDASAEAGAGAGVSTSVGTAVSSSLPKRKGNALWMGFRDKSNVHKWSPSTPASDRTWRRAEDTSPRVLNTGTRLSKRKTEDRYEPYKRRAVSPMNLGTSYTSAQAGGGAGSNSPLMMPISSPSGLVYRGIHQAQLAYARYSTSPTISRPCTPVGGNQTAGAAGAAGAVAMGGFSPAASGSGPGYGSGALGLSISANNANLDARAGEELDAVMDQRVGMLGLS